MRLRSAGESDFWGNYFNVSGGPGCRTTFLEFLDRIYSLLGIRLTRVMERRWFALKNFHMVFFEDSSRLNAYLNHWQGGQSLDDYFLQVWNAFPWYLKATGWFAKQLPPYRALMEFFTREKLKNLAYEEDGTMHWIRSGDQGRIKAFYGSLEAFEKIPGWDADMPLLDLDQTYMKLQHGYDESKEKLDIRDLRKAAEFRGCLLYTSDAADDSVLV